MIATVRLDDALSDKLENLCDRLHKKKSDVIRDAIVFYAQNMEAHHKSKIQKAVEKVMEADQREYIQIEGTLDDGL
ncbi:ribbon-helix-helix protein, CopG family [Nitratifractor sp.]